MKWYTGGQLGVAVGAACALAAALAAQWVWTRTDLPRMQVARGRYVYELAGTAGEKGLYCFSTEQTTGQLRAACCPAGGLSPAAGDSAKVIAGSSRVVFGPQIRIEPMSGRDRLNFFLPVSINTASAEDLDLIPGIGSRTAQAMIAYRNAHQGIRDLAELAAVQGMSRRKLQSLMPYLTIGP